MEKDGKRYVKATLSIGYSNADQVDIVEVPMNASTEQIDRIVRQTMEQYIEVWFEDFEDEEELEQYM